MIPISDPPLVDVDGRDRSSPIDVTDAVADVTSRRTPKPTKTESRNLVTVSICGRSLAAWLQQRFIVLCHHDVRVRCEDVV